MGNPFMPSVAGSLNQAGQDTLLQLLQRRAMEEEFARRNMALQQNAAMDQFQVAMKLQDQAQQERDFGFRKQQAEARAGREADETAEKKRAAANELRAQDIFATGVQQGAKREDLVRAAIDGKVPVSLMPREPVKKPTLEEKVAEAEALTAARESTKAKFDKPKATKVAKDNVKAPSRFIQTLQGRVGSPGFENAENAIKSVTNRWQDWRKNYPGLDLNAVRAAVQNLYGQRVGGGGTDAIAAAVLEALKNDKDDQ